MKSHKLDPSQRKKIWSCCNWRVVSKKTTTNNKGLLCCTTKILIHDNLKEIPIWHTWSWQIVQWRQFDHKFAAWIDHSPFFTWCGVKDYITTNITTLANKCSDFKIRNCLGCNSNIMYRMVLQSMHYLFLLQLPVFITLHLQSWMITAWRRRDKFQVLA